MRTLCVVEAPPLLDQELRFGERGEDFAVQAFIPQLAVEALAIAVLPGAAGLDVECFYVEPGEPIAHGGGNELRADVRANVLRGARIINF